MLLVGSKALEANLGFHQGYKDIDLIGTKQNAYALILELQPEDVMENDYIITLKNIKQNSTFDRNNVEILLSDNSESLKMYLQYATGSSDSSMEIIPAPLEVLYSLKKSHINFPVRFKKHIQSYALMSQFTKHVDSLEEITKINFKETEARIGALRTPKLNKSAKKFFGQSNAYVRSFFIHDHIHEMVAHFEKPGYTYMQPDPTSAMCSKRMWDSFTEDMKKKTVLEECYVIALERKILPMLFGGGEIVSEREAFDWAFSRVCTTLCSGWFREYATNHYFVIDMFYNPEYVTDFLQKYEDGLIQRCD